MGKIGHSLNRRARRCKFARRLLELPRSHRTPDEPTARANPRPMAGSASTPRNLEIPSQMSLEYWIARSSRAMTVGNVARLDTVIASASEAIHGPRQERTDCFVALLLAMTWRQIQMWLRDLAARGARVLQKTVSPLLTVEGAGNAGCPMHPQPRVRNKIKHTSVVTTVTPETPGIPRAMVLRLTSRSPR
jgi:hypothetical protein